MPDQSIDWSRIFTAAPPDTIIPPSQAAMSGDWRPPELRWLLPGPEDFRGQAPQQAQGPAPTGAAMPAAPPPPPAQRAGPPPIDTWGLGPQPIPSGGIVHGMTGEEVLARRGMPSPNGAALNPAALGQVGNLPSGPPPQQLLGGNRAGLGAGPGLLQLQMMGAQPAMSFNGNTMTSRNVNQPALAELQAGMRPAHDTLIATETQTPMDPQHIASWMGGQLAPTQEQKALALDAFSKMQQGAAGLMNSQTDREYKLGDLALRHQTELSGNIPTALLQTQIGAKNALDIHNLESQESRRKAVEALFAAGLPKDEQGKVNASPQQLIATLDAQNAYMQGHGLAGNQAGGGPAAGAGQAPAAAPADPMQQYIKAIQGANPEGSGDQPLRAVNNNVVNSLLGEKDAQNQWKYQGDPLMGMARLKQLLPPDQYANSPDAIRAFLSQHYGPGVPGQSARSGALRFVEPLGAGPGRAIASMLGKSDRAEQTLPEILQRALGVNQPYWDAAADVRGLYPRQ